MAEPEQFDPVRGTVKGVDASASAGTAAEPADDTVAPEGVDLEDGRHPDDPAAGADDSLESNWKEFDEAVMRSLRMAAKDAHLLAYQTGTGVVAWRDGKVVVVAPAPAMYEDLIPPPFQEGHTDGDY